MEHHWPIRLGAQLALAVALLSPPLACTLSNDCGDDEKLVCDEDGENCACGAHCTEAGECAGGTFCEPDSEVCIPCPTEAVDGVHNAAGCNVAGLPCGTPLLTTCSDATGEAIECVAGQWQVCDPPCHSCS